jgi:DNA-directed RNA polymerase subunit RPC12/RpoP
MKKFIKNNQSFTCVNCGREVEKHSTSSRDHCNYCLFGLHVDINPGDRLNECKGLLKPIGIKLSNRKNQIAYECQLCHKKVLCVVASDDNRQQLLKLAGRVWQD